jgi:hypothetical protein
VDAYEEAAVKIVQAQEAIIGPVAIEQAYHIAGLTLDWDEHTVMITGDKTAVLEDLVQKYKDLFGHISVEVSKDAASSVLQQLPAQNLPQLLQ